jgi:hypothetical protein
MEHSGDEERGHIDLSPDDAPQQQQPPFPGVPSSTEHHKSQNHHRDTLIAETLSSGLSISNGTVLPPTSLVAESSTSTSTSTRTKDRPISGVVPPYWRHQRNFSRASLTSVDTGRSSKPAITLEDHTEDPNSETSRGLWAKSVTIAEHVVVSGMTGVGAYVVWICKIQTLDVSRVH